MGNASFAMLLFREYGHNTISDFGIGKLLVIYSAIYNPHSAFVKGGVKNGPFRFNG